MLRKLTLIFISLFVARTVNAQIAITCSDYIHQNSMRRIASPYQAISPDSVRPLVLLSGPQRTWDFSRFAYRADIRILASQLLLYSSETPFAGDPHFVSATHTMSQNMGSTGYTYYRIDSNEMWNLGYVQGSGKASVIAGVYSPPQLTYKFPLSYGSSWQSVDTFNEYARPAGETIIDSIVKIIDGDGTLVLPGGVTVPTLRLKTLSNTRTITPNGETRSTHITFQWLTNDNYLVAIATDSNLRPLVANYVSFSPMAEVAEQPPDLPFIFTVVPNEGGSIVHLRVSQPGRYEVEVMDLLGRRAKILSDQFTETGERWIPIDRSELTGVYFIVVRNEKVISIRKCLIQQ